MKGTKHFKEIIQNYLEQRKAEDTLFREKAERVNRPIDDIITAILNYVQKSGCNGFSDEEIFGLATHFAEEETIEIGKPINCGVVVNHHIELTEEEKAEQRAAALKRYQEEELRKLQTRNSKPKAVKPQTQQNHHSLIFKHMKARTSFEKSVVAANKRLTDIAQKQIDWAVNKCVSHIAFRNAHGNCVCGDCGHSFIYDGKAKNIRCPHCGKLLTINDTKKRNIECKTYFGTLEILDGIQVLRVHLLEVKYRKGLEPQIFAGEVCRLWVSNKGHIAATSLRRCLGWYVDSFNWQSKIELRQLSDVLMHISDCYIYPHYRLLPELRRNGLKSISMDVHPVSLMKALLTDPRIETLQKRGDQNGLKHFLQNGSDLKYCWDSYKIAMRRGYLPDDMMMWCDLIKLLDKCGRDIRNPKYVCPTDLKAEHDHWLNKVRKAEQKKRDEIQLKKAKEDEANFYATKSCYFGIVIADTDIEISVLDTIEAYKDEGEHMKHCVFRASYYSKPESIILSAHDREGNRIETIEFSLTDGRVIQSRGVCNTNTDYHDRIVNLVNSNAYRFLEAKATA